MDTHIPKPGTEHEALARMAGTWNGEETMMPSPWSPKKESRTGRTTSRMLEGFFLVSDYEQRAGAKVAFRGHGVFSWDQKAEQYVMYWFDSMGGAGGVATGGLEGNVLTFRNTSPMGQHRYRYTFEPDGAYRFDIAMSQDGKDWQSLMEARYTKA